ncbi:hypothetical protein [Dictyobacter kobayashii]|uniref:Uncharacterized protein n=1 Tax=Dictyobacter kobayashii TaxID=2014872 RepID=A0A402AP92_9CHLR|nr:hypothetical protein [Dictyobacter kobayashii]GCE21008.1 hypothetical protein KDK_48080 [Dictyobacter kobayashii]
MNILILGGFFGIAIIALAGLIFLVRNESNNTKARHNIATNQNTPDPMRSTNAATFEFEEQEEGRVSANTMPMQAIRVPNEHEQMSMSGRIPVVRPAVANEQMSMSGRMPAIHASETNEQMPTVRPAMDNEQMSMSGRIPVVRPPIANEQMSMSGRIPAVRTAREDEMAWFNGQLRELEVEVDLLNKQAEDFIRRFDTLKLILIQIKRVQKNQQEQAEAHNQLNQGIEENLL